jgi:hypothetical protein
MTTDLAMNGTRRARGGTRLQRQHGNCSLSIIETPSKALRINDTVGPLVPARLDSWPAAMP